MKQRFLSLAITCLCLFTWPSMAETPCLDTPPDGTQIELIGSLMLGAGPNSIMASADRDAIRIYFYQDFGYVEISVFNDSGCMIHSSVVNTAMQQLVIIPITGAPSGSYTLVLENANGYAEGEFEKN